MDKILYIYIVLSIHSLISQCHGYMRVCYYTNWAQYRNGIARFVPENIDPELCTHLIYAFAKLDGNRLAAVEWNDDSTAWSKGMYEKFNDLKIQNPSLKTLLAVGGWNFGSKKFSDMAASKESRSEFVSSVITFLRKRKFDGIDIDWEYPAARGGPPQDRLNLANLMKEMRKAFKKESESSGKPELLLTMAVPADEEKIQRGYDVPTIANAVDFLNIMTYDFHGAWDPTTGHNSPLYARSTDFSYGAQKNMKWVADYWLKKGTPRDKMVIGFPLFGRGFTLKDTNNFAIGAEATTGSHAGPFTKEIGYISYFEVCKMISDGSKVYRDDEQKVPYLVKGDQWIGYDDQDSYTVKANWVKQNKFGGVMVWSLALDDFSGTACKTGTKFPMMKTIKRVLEQKELTTSTPPELTSQHAISTTPLPVSVPTDQLVRATPSVSTTIAPVKVPTDPPVKVMPSVSTTISPVKVPADPPVKATPSASTTISPVTVPTDPTIKSEPFISKSPLPVSIPTDTLTKTDEIKSTFKKTELSTSHNILKSVSNTPEESKSIFTTESSSKSETTKQSTTEKVLELNWDSTVLKEETILNSVQNNASNNENVSETVNIKKGNAHQISISTQKLKTVDDDPFGNDTLVSRSSGKLIEREKNDSNDNSTFTKVQSRSGSNSGNLTSAKYSSLPSDTFINGTNFSASMSVEANSSVITDDEFAENANVTENNTLLETSTQTESKINSSTPELKTKNNLNVSSSLQDINQTAIVTKIDAKMEVQSAIVSNPQISIKNEKVNKLKTKRERRRRKYRKNRKQKSKSRRRKEDKTKTNDRVERSLITDYSTSFRSRSLLQASEGTNRGSRSGFGSVLNSLLEVVSNFASGVGSERNNQQTQDSTNQRQQNTGNGRSRQQQGRQQPPDSTSARRRNNGSRRTAVTAVPRSNDQRRILDRIRAEERERQILTGGFIPSNAGTDSTQLLRRRTQNSTPVQARVQNRNGNAVQRQSINNDQTQIQNRERFVSFNNGRVQSPRQSENQVNRPIVSPEPTVLRRQSQSQQQARGNNRNIIRRPTQRRLTLEQNSGTQVGQNLQGRPQLRQNQPRIVTENRSRQQNNQLPNTVNSVPSRNIARIHQPTQNTQQSSFNQVADPQNNLLQNELNVARLRAIIRQAQQRRANENRNNALPDNRRLNRIGTTVQPLILQDRSNSNSINPGRIPSSGIELDITDLTRVADRPPTSRTILESTNPSQAQPRRNRFANVPFRPTLPSIQEQSDQILTGNDLTMQPVISNTMIQNSPMRNRNSLTQSVLRTGSFEAETTNRQPERNLAVQPNVNARRISTNNLLALQRRLRFQQSDNALENTSQNRRNVKPNDISVLSNMIFNNIPRNRIPDRSLGRSNINRRTEGFQENNQILSTAGHMQRSSPNTILTNNNLISPNAAMTLMAIPNALQQAQNNRIPSESNSPINSLRLDDLKLTPGNLRQNVDSVLGQLKDFQQETNSLTPNSVGPPSSVNARIVGLLNGNIQRTTTQAPVVQKPRSKGVIGLLRERFPQLSEEQITALNTEIQRQVDLVKSQLKEQFKGTTVPPKPKNPTAPTKPKSKKKTKKIVRLNELLKQVVANKKKAKVSPIPDIEKFQIKAPETVGKQAVESTVKKNSSKQIKGLQLLSKQRVQTQNNQNTVDMEKIRRELVRSGLPSNLVIQINPMPLIGQRGRHGIAPTAEALGIANILPTNQPTALSRRRPNNVMARTQTRGLLQRVHSQLLPEVPTEQPMSDAIQSPHELIKNEKSRVALEMSLLPSTPETSPRQQLKPSNETVVLQSRENSNIPLPKSEVLWKWQL